MWKLLPIISWRLLLKKPILCPLKNP
jgi:hypothetical protein